MFQVYDGKTTRTPWKELAPPLSGNAVVHVTEMNYVSRGETMVVQFTSDSDTQSFGFNARYSQGKFYFVALSIVYCTL